jgi:hypothetical protein
MANRAIYLTMDIEVSGEFGRLLQLQSLLTILVFIAQEGAELFYADPSQRIASLGASFEHTPSNARAYTFV